MKSIPVKTILCCCGAGIATSMLLQMAVEEALKDLDVAGVSVLHGTFEDVAKVSPDVCVISRALENYAEKYADRLPHVIWVDDLRAGAELRGKLAAVLNVQA